MTPRSIPFLLDASALRLALSIIAAACLLTGCGGGGGADAAESSDSAAVVGVRTAVAGRRPFQETLDAIGVVAALPGHVAELSAPAPTRVTRIFVTLGEHVRAGTPLVELDRAPFDAEAQSAEVALAAAEHAYERAKRLVDAGIMARKELDLAASDRARARAAAVSARRNRTLAELRSPIGGVVTRLSAVLGGSADPAQPLVEVADPGALEILLQVSPSAAARIRTGAEVVLSAGQHAAAVGNTGDTTAPSAGEAAGDTSASSSASGASTSRPPTSAPERLGTGVVRDVGATVDSASGSVVVYARIASPSRALRIGETVFGRIVVDTHPDAVTVPVQALVPEGEGMKVFVLDSANVAHATPVSVGSRTNELAEITRGLSGGETVVTYGAYGVTDGAHVEPVAESGR